MSDNTPQQPADVPPTSPPAPYGAPAPQVPGADVPPPPPGYGAPAQPQPAPPYPTPEAAPPAYGYPQAPAPYGYAGSAYPAPPRTNGLAITSLISAIAAFVVLPFIASVVAVITGHIALRQLRTNGEAGRGLALAGTIVGWVGIGFAVLVGLFIAIAIAAAISAGASYSSYS